MKKSLNLLAVAAAATVALLSVPGAAKAQVAFGGTIRGPHGAFSVGVGPFVPRVGISVPVPYYDEVYLDPDYGYGFYYDSEWIPCAQYGSGWVIVERNVFRGRPVIFGRVFARGDRSFRGTRDFGRGFANRDAGRGFADRNVGRGFADRNVGRSFSNRDNGRSVVRQDAVRRDFARRAFEGRRDGGRRDSGGRDNRRDGGGRDNRHGGGGRR